MLDAISFCFEVAASLGADRLRASLCALMRVIVRVAYFDKITDQRVMISGLIRLLDSPEGISRRATLRYDIFFRELQTDVMSVSAGTFSAGSFR
jgi:hypothetical protein